MWVRAEFVYREYLDRIVGLVDSGHGDHRGERCTRGGRRPGQPAACVHAAQRLPAVEASNQLHEVARSKCSLSIYVTMIFPKGEDL